MKKIPLLLCAFFYCISLSFSQTKQFRNNLYIIDPKGNPVLMDGTLNMYHDDYSDEVDYMDARKMFNPGENIGILRNDKVLIVERRQEIENRTDTIFYKFWNSRIITYRLEFSAKYFDNSGVTAVLHDKYLNKKVNISMLDNTYYDFAVTADVNSKRNDRFMVVFNPVIGEVAAGVMPLNFIGSTASVTNNGVTITWVTANESNVKEFRIEKSADGVLFEETGNPVLAQNLLSNQYSVIHGTSFEGAAYYRIKATDLDGRVSYSKIMKVNQVSVAAKVSLYPNPASVSDIHLNASGLSAGQYKIRIINTFGAIVHLQTGTLNAEYERIRLTVATPLTKGIYHVELTGPNGYRSSHSLMIK